MSTPAGMSSRPRHAFHRWAHLPRWGDELSGWGDELSGSSCGRGGSMHHGPHLPLADRAGCAWHGPSLLAERGFTGTPGDESVSITNEQTLSEIFQPQSTCSPPHLPGTHFRRGMRLRPVLRRHPKEPLQTGLEAAGQLLPSSPGHVWPPRPCP